MVNLIGLTLGTNAVDLSFQYKLYRITICIVLAMLLASCSPSLRIVDKPITFNEERKELSLQYMVQRHGIKSQEASIVPRMIVVHWTAIPDLDRSFQAFSDPKLPSHRESIASASSLNVSAHFLVDRDGTVFQLIPETTFARHVIGLNHCAIGIENVGDGDNFPLTDEQLKSNIRLIKKLLSQYPIDYVIGHHEYQNFVSHPLWKETDPQYLTEKSDPGEEFMLKIRRALQGLGLKEVPERSGISESLYAIYENYKQPSITYRRFKHADIEPLILSLRGKPHFNVTKVGESIEGKSIHLVSYGNGSIPVYLWSQMHGDEPTATMALMDIFQFLEDDEHMYEFKRALRDKLTLHFIPLLNPDGADNYQRRNALGVDLNRDALRLQNPESQILKRVRDSLQAVWGFNLHDQSRYYGAGVNNPHTATVSFLAPAYDYEKNINTVRGNAMRLIGVMNQILQQYIPGKIAKYNDDFEPRAFGDNIQKWGTSTILIESGGLKGDREKQYIRKLHFIAILSAFHHIAQGTFQEYGLDIYNQIPFNDSNAFHDLILRKLTIEKNGSKYIMDVAFRYSEIELEDGRTFYLRAGVSDLGDMSTMFGYEDYDMESIHFQPGKIYPEVFQDHVTLQSQDVMALMQQGFTVFRIAESMDPITASNLPYKTVSPAYAGSEEIRFGSNPSGILMKNGRVIYFLNNGHVFDGSGRKVMSH
ncbi:MAG TPA: N-acetylmuramoyl-L-alanine amidase [Saprospiraceae bacterium]|nr:N-acetylmuramoyl-L-alanine amidase [Saprospiraceae bacterium]